MHSRPLWKDFITGVLLGGSLLSFGAARAADEPKPLDPRDVLRSSLVERCEKRWTNNFVPMAKAQLPADDPVNDESRAVVLDVSVDRKGKLVRVDVLRPSGATGLDEAARDIVGDMGVFPRPDESLLSDDGHLHVSWSFARKDGRCDDVQVEDVHLPPEQAVASLLAQGRDQRALERLAEAVAVGHDKAVTLFARQWLKRARSDRKLGFEATGALASSGDREATLALVSLAAAGKLPPAFLPALARAGQAVCPMAQKALADKNPEARKAALSALGLHFDKACLGSVVALAVSTSTPVDERTAALRALAAADAEDARAAAKKAMDDPQPKIRAAAIRSWAQADMGRRALFGLTPLLKDPQMAIRAAAAAGIVRSSGDKGIEQLYLLYKEKDPQIFEAVAEELGQLATEASADMLKKLLRKDDPRIRRAAAAALARRGDRHALAAQTVLASESDVSLRVLGGQALNGAEAQGAAAALTEVASARWAYGLLVEAGQRSTAGHILIGHFAAVSDAARIDWLGTWLRAGEPPSNVASSRP
ncbi:MAG: energy transducer TonB [Myxococcales bacterium]|nr:energy transducer TonB [Myxococcales bacterium]